MGHLCKAKNISQTMNGPSVLPCMPSSNNSEQEDKLTVDRAHVNDVTKKYYTRKVNRMARDPSSAYISNSTPLCVAVKEEDISKVERLLANGANPNHLCSYHDTDQCATDDLSNCNPLQLFLFRKKKHYRNTYREAPSVVKKSKVKEESIARKIITLLVYAGTNLNHKASLTHSWAYYTEDVDDTGDVGETDYGLLSNEEIASRFNLQAIYQHVIRNLVVIKNTPQFSDTTITFK